MLGLTLASLRARPLRALLTAFSIVLGVAMISGTFVVTGQIDRAFSEIFEAVNVKNDVVVEVRTVSDTNQGFPEPFSNSVLVRVGKVPGVAAAMGEVDALGSLVKFDKGVPKAVSSPGGAPPLVFSTPPPRFDPGMFIRGHSATRTGEVALIEDTAKKADVDVGATVGLVTLDGLKRLKVVGIYRIGTTASLGGALVSSIPLRDAQRWYGLEGQYTQVNLQAAPGVSHAELRDRVRAVLGNRFKVQTGEEKAKADSKGIADIINGFLGPALLAFGGVAVLVGAFIIFNMFSITVAQRIREIAMLRTLGASRRQILTSVLLEALVTAVVGSLIGIFLGLLIAAGINALFDAVGFGLPSTSPQLSRTGVILGLVVGLGVTLFSALIPAVRATRIPPMAGLREGATLPRSRFARYTPILAGLFAIAGAALIANGVTGSGEASQRLLGMAGGAVLVFFAVAMTARFAVPILARIVGAPLAWRASGALARDNAMRNAARTARTAAALMIGVGLVVFVAVFAQGLRTSFTSALDRSLKSDLIVTPTDQQGGGTLAPRIVPALEGIPGVGVASALSQGDVRRDGRHGGAENGLYGVQPSTPRPGLQSRLGHGEQLRPAQPERQSDPAREGRGLLPAREGRRSGAPALQLAQDGKRDRDGHLQGRQPAAGRDDHDAAAAPPDRHQRRADRAGHGQERQQSRAGGEAGHGTPGSAVPDRQAAVECRVQAIDRRPGQPVALPDLRAARRKRPDLAVRHRQHAAAVGLRTHARDRHAARDRHDTAPAATHDPLRERHHGRHRQPARTRHRRRLRLDRDAGALESGTGVLGALGDADRLPDRGGDRGHPGGRVACLARLAHEGAGRPQLRVGECFSG